MKRKTMILVATALVSAMMFAACGETPATTDTPTAKPTSTTAPTKEPTKEPTNTPTLAPTDTPEPTATATPEPTATPTPEPTATPTPEPTEAPTVTEPAATDEHPEDLLAGIWEGDYGAEYIFYKPGEGYRVSSSEDYAYWSMDTDGYYAFSNSDDNKVVFKTYSAWSDTGHFRFVLEGETLQVYSFDPSGEDLIHTLHKVKCHYDENMHDYEWDE